MLLFILEVSDFDEVYLKVSPGNSSRQIWKCHTFRILATEPVDWTFAQLELLEKQGIDLRTEMESRYVTLPSEQSCSLESSWIYSTELLVFVCIFC